MFKKRLSQRTLSRKENKRFWYFCVCVFFSMLFSKISNGKRVIEGRGPGAEGKGREEDLYKGNCVCVLFLNGWIKKYIYKEKNERRK